MEEEEDEMISPKGQEMDVLFEDFSPIRAYDPITLERIVKLIPKMEASARVKVFLESGKYTPVTKTGATLVMAYRQVGFSYIPVIVVEPPENRKETYEAALPKWELERMRELLRGREEPIHNWAVPVPRRRR
jgi:hypothetical protein